MVAGVAGVVGVRRARLWLEWMVILFKMNLHSFIS
jgi:hypothetical protein